MSLTYKLLRADFACLNDSCRKQWMFSSQVRRRHSSLKEELVNGYKNFNRTMCKIVFHSLLNLTHHTRFLFVPNPNVVSYRP